MKCRDSMLPTLHDRDRLVFQTPHWLATIGVFD